MKTYIVRGAFKMRRYEGVQRGGKEGVYLLSGCVIFQYRPHKTSTQKPTIYLSMSVEPGIQKGCKPPLSNLSMLILVMFADGVVALRYASR